MQEIERHTLLLALAIVTDEFEGCGLGVAVHGHELLLIIDIDAVACRDLDQRAGKIRHAENGGRVREEGDRTLFEDAAPAQAVGNQVGDLLRSAGAFERQGRLRANDLVSGLELLHAFPGVVHACRRIIAAHAVGAERLGEADDLVPIEVHAGADHQIFVGERVAIVQADRILLRLETLGRAADPDNAGRYETRFRAMGFRQRIDTCSDQGKRRLVIMLLLGLNDRDIQVAGMASQNRRHRNAGGAPADDEDPMMLSVRHWSFPLTYY